MGESFKAVDPLFAKGDQVRFRMYSIKHSGRIESICITWHGAIEYYIRATSGQIKGSVYRVPQSDVLSYHSGVRS